MQEKTFPWIKNYPSGIPATISGPDYESVTDMLESNCREYSDREAFVNMGKSLTYGDVARESEYLAAYFQQKMQLRKGDRIAIQMPNILQYPVVMMAAMRAGLIIVNTNPLYTPREMEHQYRDAEIKAVVIVANFAGNLEQVLKKYPVANIIITELGDMLGAIKGTVVNFVVKRIKKMVPDYRISGAVNFKEAIREGKKLHYEPVPSTLEDIAFLQYTGGTTGISKGAQLSHGNILAHTRQIRLWFNPLLKASEQDVMITAIPLYHIFALTVNGLLMWRIGAKNILITNPRDMKSFIGDLKKYSFTLLTGVNTLFNGLLNQEEFAKVDFSNLKGTIGGGMAVQDSVARKWLEVTHTPLMEGYGLSETSPVLSCNPLDGTHRIGTIGLPTPDTEMAIFSEEGKQLPEGEVGEICARGPQVMRGYWNKNNDNVFFPGNWFRTGDMGMMDSDGFFRIVDRKKDMINVSGFNVYPNEVENVIANHQSILEVAAIGVPDKHSGEVVKVFIVRKEPGLSEEEVKDYCHKNLTGYKRPKYIEFRDELPKSNVGKIIRRELREGDPLVK